MAAANTSLDNINMSLDVSGLNLSLESTVSLNTELAILRDISAAACSGCDDTMALLKLYRGVFETEKKLQEGAVMPADYEIESQVKVFWPETETVWDGQLKAINAARMTCTVVFELQGPDGLMEEETNDMPLAWIIRAV